MYINVATRIAGVLLLLLALLTPLAKAADDQPAPRPVDQLFSVDMQPVLIPTPAEIKPSTLDLKEEQLGSIVNQILAATTKCTVPAPPPSDGGNRAKDSTQSRKQIGKEDDCKIHNDTYYVLHLIEHVPGTVDTRRQRWYVYYQGWIRSGASQAQNWLADPYRTQHFREARLFGARRMTMMYLHYNVAAVNTSKTARDSIVKENQQALAQIPVRENMTPERYVAAVLERTASLADLFGQSMRDLLEQLHKDIPAGITAEVADTVKATFENGLRSNLNLPPGDTATLQSGLDALIDKNINQAFDKALGKTARSTFTLSTDKQKQLKPVSYRPPEGKQTKDLDPGQVLIDAGYLPIFYQVEVTKKQPDNQRNLVDVLMGALNSEAIAIHVNFSEPVYALCGIEEGMQIQHRTSDIAVKGFRGDRDNKPQEIGAQLYDNESRYWWDFSFAFPAKGVEDLKLEQVPGAAPGLFTARKIEKKNVLATVNVFPGRVDTKRVGWRFLPQFMYGVGITKQPFNTQLFAVGIGASFAQPFFGKLYSKTEDRDAAGQPVFKTDWKWTWGINLQPRGVLAIFKKAAGN